MITYRVHACHQRIVCCRLVLSRHQETAPLSSREVDHVRNRGLVVNTIDFNDGHVVALKPYILTSEGPYVDYTEEVSRPRLDRYLQVLRVVEESGLWDGFSSGGVAFADEPGQQISHLIMVPVRDGQYHLIFLLVQCVQEGRIGVMDDERSPKPVRILSIGVGMVPIRAGLVDLFNELTLSFAETWVHYYHEATNSEVIGEARAWRNGAL